MLAKNVGKCYKVQKVKLRLIGKILLKYTLKFIGIKMIFLDTPNSKQLHYFARLVGVSLESF